MTLLDPEMPIQELRLHMGEITYRESLVARAAIRWANTKLMDHKCKNAITAIDKFLGEK